jgi:hypothetical protein
VAATLALYFTPAKALVSLDPARCPPPPRAEGLELSPREAPDIARTAGRKDLRRLSTGAPWPLAHLPRGPRAWGPSLGAYLQGAGARVVDEDSADATTCFALDTRLAEHTAWLAAAGVSPGAVCTVYALSLSLPGPVPGWTHLSTSEI